MESQVFKHVHAAPQAGHNWIVATSPWYADYLNMAETPTDPAARTPPILAYRGAEPVESAGDLGARTASGTMWMASQTIVTRFTSLASQVLLAKLLLNEDFGRIGLVYTITALATQVTNLGIDDVLLQKQRHLLRWTTAAFWFGLVTSIGGGIVMVVAAMIVVVIAKAHGNAAYGDSSLIWLTAILAMSAPLANATLVPTVILRSEMRFVRLASVGFGDVVLQQLLMVLFAAMGMGAYSFVLPVPIAAVARLAVLWSVVHPKIRPQLSLHRWPSLISSGGWIFGQRLLFTATSQGDYLILAALYADTALVGTYFFAFMLSTQVIRLICDNAGATLTPALSAIRDNRSRMWQAARRANRALAALVVPAVTLQILLAGPIVRVLFASKWESSIVLIRWLSAGPLLYYSIWPMAAIITATGRFSVSFLVWLVGAITFAAMVYPATRAWGVNGTAASVAAWCWIMSAYYAFFTYRSLSGIGAMLSDAYPTLASAAVGALPCGFLVWSLPTSMFFSSMTIALTTLIFSVTYLACMGRLDAPSIATCVRFTPAFAKPWLRKITSIPADPA